MQLFHRYIFGMNQLNKYSVKDENNKEYFGIALKKKRLLSKKCALIQLNKY